MSHDVLSLHFFFNDPATTEIYTLSLHDALPISLHLCLLHDRATLVTEEHFPCLTNGSHGYFRKNAPLLRSEEHTSELQTHLNLVSRLLLEKKIATYLTPTKCVVLTRHSRQSS